MKKLGIFLLGGCLLLGAMASGTTIEPEAGLSAAGVGGPVFVEPDSDPMRTAPSTPRVRLQSRQIQTGSEIIGLTVFTETGQRLGLIEDLLVNFDEGRIEFVLVVPSAGFAGEPNFSYALGATALEIDGDGRQLVVEIPEEEIRRAQAISLGELMALAEFPEENRDAVYRVGVVRPFPVDEPYVQLPQPAINGYQEPGPFYAEPRHSPDFGGSYPPEYRGGYPPEYRGGYPPEYRSTFELDEPQETRPRTYGGRDRE